MEKYLLQAAERGDADAQFNLGIVYENGLDDTRYIAQANRPDAMRWFIAAAEQGLPRAQIKLAEIYADDLDTPGSAVKACGWFLLATASLQGAHLHRAHATYQRLSRRFTPVQTAEVRRFAQNWKPKEPARTAPCSQREAADRARA